MVFHMVDTRGLPGFTWYSPGIPLVHLVTKRIWFHQGENLVFWFGRKNLVNARGKPGIHWFSRKTDTYQGKIGFPGEYQVFPRLNAMLSIVFIP